MMKKLKCLLLSATMLSGWCTYSQLVVSLHSNNTVQHFIGTNALINAYAASVSGDTIYLPGGAFSPPPNFDKGIAIFGAGHYPDSTIATGKSYIYGTVYLNNNADNFHLEGVEITNSFIFTANNSANQVVVKYCKINGPFDVQGNLATPSSNLALIGNVFLNDVTLSNATNTGIYNCIFQAHLVNSAGNAIFNNVFLYPGYNSDPVLSIGNNNNINSNIFLQTGFYSIVSGSGNAFRNNVFVLASPDLGVAPITQNNYNGVSQASLFLSQSGNNFNYSHNYHLQNPGSYTGFDGSQAGLFGGVFPYKNGAVPSNPHIRWKYISPVSDSNGNINVNIVVAAQDN